MEESDDNRYTNVNILLICKSWQQYLKNPFSLITIGDPVDLYNKFIEECKNAPLSDIDISRVDINLIEVVKYCIDIQKIYKYYQITYRNCTLIEVILKQQLELRNTN